MTTRLIVNARLANEGRQFDGNLAWNGMALLAEQVGLRQLFDR